MKKIALYLLALISVGSAWGYDDLPDVFNETTGYVITSGGSDGASAQSFYYGTHWSDGLPPHSNTNYYVTPFSTLATPFQDSDVAAQLLVDPNCQTFKGRKLVVAGTIWHINATYDFTFPDMRLLPGGKFYCTGVKTPLKGAMKVYGTTNSPSIIRVSWDTASLCQGCDMDVKGDAASCLNLFSEQKPPFVRLGGDLSEFYGTLRVSQCTYGSWESSPTHYGWGIDSANVGGTVELLGTYSCLCVRGASGLTVGGFVNATNTTRIVLDVAGASSVSTPRLTITNRLDLARPVEVLLDTLNIASGGKCSFGTFAESSTPEERALIRLTPEAVASCVIRDLNEMFVVKSSMNRSWTLWRDDPDGGKTLWLVTCVKHTSNNDTTERSSLVYDTLTESGTDYFWDSEVCPANDSGSAGKGYYSATRIYTPNCNSYDSICEFPGKLLVMASSTFNGFKSSAGFFCRDFVWLGTLINTASNGTSTDPARKDESGNSYKFYKLQGKIRVPSGYTNKLQSYGQRCVVRVESEVSGGGDLQLQTIDASGNFKNNCGYHEFTALNTNFTGKVKVTTLTRTASGSQTPLGYTTPNWIEHVRLFVSDERNLGGSRDAFAWDALYLDQYSDIYPLNDVTFTDGWNRGIAIGNIGRMNVPSNLTLTVWRPLNVNGHLVKEGNGTLALGGTLTFGGSAQSATPTASSNLLTVAGGRIKPLAKNAFDGLAITFTNNAALCVDGTPANAELRQYGLVNTKEATAPIALAPNQATLPVQVDFGAATEPPDTSWTVGIVTLETVKAAALKDKMTLAVAKPFKTWRGTLDIVDNGNGTSTIVVNYEETGLMVIFR